jgi:hypothetical protein
MKDFISVFNDMKNNPSIIAIEISKQHDKNKTEAIKNGNFNEWTIERIKACFNFGNGTIKDFKNYMENNKQYCYFEVLR